MIYELAGLVFNIKKDPTRKNIYYCVMQNPFVNYYSTKVIFGGSEDIVKQKINKQYKKFEEESAKL